MDWKSKRVRGILEAALVEDKVTADITTSLTIDRRMKATGTIVANEPCVIAGLGAIPVLLEIYGELAAKAGAQPLGRSIVISHPEVFDGVKVKKGQTVAVIRANAAALLATERVLLNFLKRMSGIATVTNGFVKAIAGTKTKIVDTRKTVPGLRLLDKYAVSIGGGVNHRADLQDGILIKANHVALAGGIKKALSSALRFRKGKQWVQVEVQTMAELEEALAGGAEGILLEHMTPAAVKRAVKRIRTGAPESGRKMRIEAAGGVTLANVKAYAAAGVDFVAVGSLTSSASGVDLGMRIGIDAS